MKTKRTITKTLWNSLLIIFLGTLLAGQAHGQIFVTNRIIGTVGEYNAATGATINSALVSGFNSATGIAVSGGNLWVDNQFDGTIGEYNATTGATVNASLVSGLSNSYFLALSGGNLFVTNYSDGSIGEYDATTGATINAALVSGLNGGPFGIAVSGGNLWVTNFFDGSIGEYDATTGATINAALVSGLSNPAGIAVSEPYTAQVQQPINPDGSSVFSVRRGVIPVKFTLTQDGVATCALPPATVALTRTAGNTTGAIDESVYSGSADTGSNFRIDSCQYIYNVSASALGAGTYRVDIVIDGQVVGSATFQLK
jgi:hypothetical protein